MAGFSLRLPNELEEKLDQEARREGIARSEVARVAEARAGYGDPAIRGEALAIAEEALPLDNEALDRAEVRSNVSASARRRARSRSR